MKIVPFFTVPRAARRWRVPLPRRDGFVFCAFAAGLAIGIRLLRRERQAVQHEIEARAEAQRSAKARAALLGMVSHELRTPLQTLLVNLDLLADLQKGDDVDELAARMARALELMSTKLDSLAQYARLASGADVVRNETLRFAELLRGIVDGHVGQGRQHGRAITLDVDDNALPRITGDAVHLLQIVENYLVNALKYAGDGNITVRCSAVHNDRASAKAIEVGVIDEGPGVPDSEKEQIWEPYFRGRRAPGKTSGSGLGLAVVELLASSAGWKVGVRDTPGGGATFYVRLPIAEEAASRACAADAPSGGTDTSR